MLEMWNWGYASNVKVCLCLQCETEIMFEMEIEKILKQETETMIVTEVILY